VAVSVGGDGGRLAIKHNIQISRTVRCTRGKAGKSVIISDCSLSRFWESRSDARRYRCHEYGTRQTT
jgi:hypothetical protein